MPRYYRCSIHAQPRKARNRESVSKQGLTFDAEKFKFVPSLRVYKAHLTLQSAELKTKKIVSPYFCISVNDSYTRCQHV